MGSKIKRRKHVQGTSDDDDSPSSSPSISSDSDDRSSSKRRRRHRRDKETRKERREKRRSKRETTKRSKSKRSSTTKKKKKKRDYESNSESSSGGCSDSEPERRRAEPPQHVLRDLLVEFPNVGDDLKQLLQMIDSGQAVDIKGISEKSLIKHLKKLFISLKLKQSDGVFVLPSNVLPTLEVVGLMIPTSSDLKPPVNEMHSEQRDGEVKQVIDDDNTTVPCPVDNVAGLNKRIIGPAMPSAELLAAAAKLTEAQAELRDVELEEDAGMFIGPPPPAVVAEVASANEAERFEEVTRIMESEENSPYDILGANQNMAVENIKKRYWKMSLLVHPDKCSHPQAQQAFIKMNKAFKDLQDPEKRKVLDEKIKLKEEHEKFKLELRAMREAAQWRKLQGISMEGDDELLAEMDVKEAPKRDEWMTTLPPEKRPGGMPTQSTKFSTTVKEGRGDTSAWTDTPSDRAQKAKTNYLEAYDKAAALASNEVQKKSSDADLVDKYNKDKRSKSLVQKHQETASRPKKKSKQPPSEKEEWVGKHPWKPFDREKDLAGGRQSVKLDSENMAQGLTSRFSAGTFQRNFL